MKTIKCKNLTKRKNSTTERVCDRHLMKFVDGSIHIPCPACGHHAIISVVNGALTVVHVNKQGESILCKTAKI